MTKDQDLCRLPLSGIVYERVFPYRYDDVSLFEQFSDIYIEAFNDPDGAYQEKNTHETVYKQIWLPHLEYGRVTLAIDRCRVVGLVCVEPLACTSDEEQGFAERYLEYLLRERSINANSLPNPMYLSELAVRKEYRNRQEHIGNELIMTALRDLRARSDDGSFGRDDKFFVFTRTDAKRSMSRNTLARAGFSFHDDFLQNAETADQIIERGGQSREKVWGYKIVFPIMEW